MPTTRPMRADARRNRDRLLTEARLAFAAHGTTASLEDIARRADVGIGTLYRHFPNRQALLSAVFEEAVGDLLAHARAQLDAPEPCSALLAWLRDIITHAGEYRGLAQALMTVSYTDSRAVDENPRTWPGAAPPSGRRAPPSSGGRNTPTPYATTCPSATCSSSRTRSRWRPRKPRTTRSWPTAC